MKIKLKKGVVLPNNWKTCKCTADNWADLNSGKSIEVNSVPKLIEDNVDVVEPASKSKNKNKESK